MGGSDLYSGDERLLERLSKSGPVNRTRAQEIMERFGIDALVLGDPLNVFHALGYWPQIASTKVGQPPTTFAILFRDPGLQPAIVTSHFIYYYTFADGGPRDRIPAFLYDGAGDSGESTPVEASPAFFPDLNHAPVTSVEARRRAQTDHALSGKRYVSDAGGALVQALREFGLESATIGFDHDVFRAVHERHDLTGALIPADNIMRWIRIVKSPLELDLMRRGALGNVDAVNAVVAAVRAGANYRDLRQLFDIEAAKRGNKSVFMTIDRVSSTIPVDDRVVDGQSLFIDGVSHFQNYHGDYARTVFVGEPNAEGRRVAKAATQGWDAIREHLKPGMKYSDAVAIGLETLRKVGAADQIGFGPHSVGLMHTDEPGADHGGFYGKENLVLEENMVISVDCPSIVTGIGGSVHLEDLVLITRDGAETIHPVHDHVITI